MKKAYIFAVLSTIASLAAVPAASAQDVTCESGNFSEEVTNRFAGIRYSCLEIVERNGEPHAMLNAEVTRVAPPKLTVRFKRTDDGLTNPVTLTPASDHVFTLDNGKKLALRDLTVSSILRVYVPIAAPIGKVGFEIDPATGEVTYFELDGE